MKIVVHLLAILAIATVSAEDKKKAAAVAATGADGGKVNTRIFGFGGGGLGQLLNTGAHAVGSTLGSFLNVNRPGFAGSPHGVHGQTVVSPHHGIGGVGGIGSRPGVFVQPGVHGIGGRPHGVSPGIVGHTHGVSPGIVGHTHGVSPGIVGHTHGVSTGGFVPHTQVGQSGFGGSPISTHGVIGGRPVPGFVNHHNRPGHHHHGGSSIIFPTSVGGSVHRPVSGGGFIGHGGVGGIGVPHGTHGTFINPSNNLHKPGRFPHHGSCPKTRGACPLHRDGFQLQFCDSDSHCSRHQKCCYDACVKRTVCKTALF